MSDSLPRPQVSKFLDLVQRFVRLRPRLKVVQSEDLMKFKALLDESHPKGRAEIKGDYNLLYSVGTILSHQQSITMGELSRALDVPLSTATRIVDWLVNSGVAARVVDPNDRRSVHVALTEVGLALFRAHNDYMRKRIEKIMRHFTSDERDTLLKLMEKLAVALEEEAISGQ
jgi:DNA-binding MarR family transcriptional regulator